MREGGEPGIRLVVVGHDVGVLQHLLLLRTAGGAIDDLVQALLEIALVSSDGLLSVPSTAWLRTSEATGPLLKRPA